MYNILLEISDPSEFSALAEYYTLDPCGLTLIIQFLKQNRAELKVEYIRILYKILFILWSKKFCRGSSLYILPRVETALREILVCLYQNHPVYHNQNTNTGIGQGGADSTNDDVEASSSSITEEEQSSASNKTIDVEDDASLLSFLFLRVQQLDPS